MQPYVPQVARGVWKGWWANWGLHQAGRQEGLAERSFVRLLI